ncbi:hypothetical protein [Mesoplasma melaleucae]|nr:hypothetical protein [Mesoplasma melaleucae]
MKLNGKIVSQFKLVISPAVDLTNNIEEILNNIKNKFTWKNGQ